MSAIKAADQRADMAFVALAETLGAQLTTMDGKLLKAFPNIARPLVAS